MEKRRLGFWEIWNMSFGFLGIQFGWSLQLSNMTPIYEYLGSSPDEIPMLWVAAPLTGLIVQPIIGHLSDKTWSPRWGRRRPFFLIGAILASVALVFMPFSSTVWIAAGLLWILDASINISMEPFRAFVVDMLPDKQRAQGFAMQSMMIGLGSVIAFGLPYMLSNWFGVSNTSEQSGGVPSHITLAFIIGGVVFLSSVLYTVFRTKEYPPENLEEFKKNKGSFSSVFKEVGMAIKQMPKMMRRVALVQFFTWPGLFLMWFFFGSAIAFDVFDAVDTADPAYAEGTSWGGVCFAFYSLITFVFSFALPSIAGKLGLRTTHMICLIAGGLGLMSVSLVTSPYMLFLSMTGVGIAWASILSMPYSLIGGHLPSGKVGVYMGIFNFFIVLPEIIASLFFGDIMEHFLDNNRMSAVVIGGVLMLFSALLCLQIPKSAAKAIN